MAKKSFDNINTGAYYDTLAAATNEEAGQRKPTKVYSDEEAAIMEERRSTQGRKGCKLQRLNLAFTPTVYEYIRTMSSLMGITTGDFVEIVFRSYMADHHDLFDQAMELRRNVNETVPEEYRK